MLKLMKSLNYDGFLQLLNLLTPFVLLALSVRGGIEYFSQYGFQNVYDVRFWVFLVPVFVLATVMFYILMGIYFALFTYRNPLSRTKVEWLYTILSSVVIPLSVYECYYNPVSMYTVFFICGLYALAIVSRKIVSLERF